MSEFVDTVVTDYDQPYRDEDGEGRPRFKRRFAWTGLVLIAAPWVLGMLALAVVKGWLP
jgi:hypothetical protein